MTEQEQIEEIAKFMHFVTRKKDKDCEKTKCEQCWCPCKDDAERLYNAGYRIKPKKAVTIPVEERDEEKKEINKTLAERDELQELNIKYYNEAKDLRRKVADIEAENERLSAKLGQILLSIDTVKEMNAMCKIDDHRKQAVKEFGDKIKAKLFSVFGKTICSDLDTQDIADIIDEVLKEV